MVRAANLKVGDILIQGKRGNRTHQRIKAVHLHPRRCRITKGPVHKLATTGVLIVAPNPSGNALDTFTATGDEFIKVKRPKYNMGSR